MQQSHRNMLRRIKPDDDIMNIVARLNRPEAVASFVQLKSWDIIVKIFP